MVNFLPVKEIAKAVLAEVSEDPRWSWRVEVQEDRILIYWEYLQYYYKEDSHFTIMAEEENLVALDDWEMLMGKEEIKDDLGQAVEKLIRWTVKVAHHYY